MPTELDKVHFILPPCGVMVSSCKCEWKCGISCIVTSILYQYQNTHALYCTTGAVEAVKVLIELGAATQTSNLISGATPLHSAVQSSKGDLDRRIVCVQMLLQAGADPSVTDHYGSTPFDSCKQEELQVFLQPKDLPIFTALKAPHVEPLKDALRDDPSCIHVRQGGKTPLLTIIDQLIHCGNEANNEDIQQHFINIVEILLDHGADPNETSTASRDALEEPPEPPLYQVCLAIKQAYQQSEIDRAASLKRVAQLFVNHQAKSTAELEQLLHDASRRNMVDMAQFLIETIGVSVNLAGRQGMTPLQFAARSGRMEMVHFLLLQEAIDIDIPDDRGQTALGAAKANGNDDIVALLEAHQQQHHAN